MTAIDQHPLSPVFTLLNGCDPVDVVKRLAALQLIPDNASRLLRLHAATFAACCIQPNLDSRRLSQQKFQQLVQGDPLATVVGHMEDPFYALFSECMFFHGGDYTVLPGQQEDCVYIVRSLTGGLFLLKEPLSQPKFAEEAFFHLKALLILSTEMCRRAGITRNLVPATPQPRQTFIPSKANFLRLQHSVCFSDAELEDLLEKQGLSSQHLTPFTKNLGSWVLGDFQDTQSLALGEFPLARFQDQVLIASPTDLLAAWMHWVVKQSQQRGFSSVVADRFAKGVWQRVRTSFELLGLELQPMSLPVAPKNIQWRECVFSDDLDKAVHAIVLTDPLTVLPEGEFNVWHPADVPAVMAARLAEIEQYLFSRFRHLNEVLHVVVFQGLGRLTGCRIEKDASIIGDILLLTGQELEVVSHLEHHNQLALRQFTRAISAFHKASEVVSFSSLDLYDVYRTQNRSFYLSDGPAADIVQIPPDSGDARHVEMAKARDYHGVVTPDGSFLEVTAAFDGGNPPIYFSSDNPGRGFIVEGYRKPIWVVPSAAADKDQREVGERILDLISYWLSEFAGTLGHSLDWTRYQPDTFAFEVAIENADAWSKLPDDAPQMAMNRCISISRRHAEDGIMISLTPPMVTFFGGKDNAGERQFMQVLLEGVADLYPDLAAKVTKEVLANCLEHHAPLGLKKKFLVFDKYQHHSLRFQSRTRLRFIQQAVEQEALDYVGRQLIATGRYEVGPFSSKEDGVAAINDAVRLAAQRLETLIASINPKGLLQQLFAMHETLVRNTEFLAITLPTRLACFHTHESLAKEYRDELTKNNQTSLALRFIIEYVTAKPPAGFRPASLSLLDELIALASVIASFGSDSDLLHTGLTAMEVSILGSGRLGINRSAVQTLQNTHTLRWAHGEIERQTDQWQAGCRAVSTTISALKERFAAACMDEFGFAFLEMLEVVTAALYVPSETDPIVRMRQSDFVNFVASEGEITADRVQAVIDALTLVPRDKFWKPAGYPSHEVFPWRFTRAFSLARKPFAAEELDGDRWLIWGKGHLSRFVSHFQNTILSGRLEAKTPAMRELVGKITSLEGAEFVVRVEDEARRQGFQIVRKHAKKFGNLKPIDEDRNDLGDIDLLVVDTQRLKLYVLECKDLENARTPWELVHERNRMVGPLKNGKPTIEKHGRRASWVQNNCQAVLADLGVTQKGRWTVIPGIVTSVELYGPSFGTSPMRIVSIAEIRRHGLAEAFA